MSRPGATVAVDWALKNQLFMYVSRDRTSDFCYLLVRAVHIIIIIGNSGHPRVLGSGVQSPFVSGFLLSKNPLRAAALGRLHLVIMARGEGWEGWGGGGGGGGGG